MIIKGDSSNTHCIAIYFVDNLHRIYFAKYVHIGEECHLQKLLHEIGL